jgi:hypothetical protein
MINTAVTTMQKTIENEILALKESISKTVYSMDIEGIYNPVFGNITFPANMKSQILAAYYGEGEPTEFQGEPIDEFFNGDAGTVYFTVNPNNVKLDGGFALINSIGEAYDKVELSAAKPSNKILSWGWSQTRANETGLYEINAKIKTIQDAKEIELDYKTFAKDIKNLITNRNKASVTQFMQDLYSLKLGESQRLALKYNWAENGYTRSPFDLAVMAVKPLSYDFEININHVPGYDKIISTIDKMINKIQIDFGIDFSKFENVSISLDRGTKDYIINVNVQVPVNQTVTVNVPNVNVAPQPITLTYTDGAGVSHPVTGTVPGQTVTVPPTAVALNFVVNANAEANINAVVDDLFKSLNGDLGKINDMLSEVAKLSKIESKIDDTKNDIRNEIKSYIDKFDSKIVNFVNHTNDALQPTLLVKEGNTIHRPGTVKAGEIILIPTSWTAEIFAPAFMKWIQVEGAGGELEKGMIFDGTVNQIALKVETGKTYNVTYKAIDFFGKVRKKEYTIIAK